MGITPRVGEEVTLKLPGTDHRVVIVGSGFGGLFAARFLRGASIEVTLIDRTNHHLFQPLLYQVATGILSAGAIAPATRDVFRNHKNIEVEMGDVTAFDLDAKRVTATRPDGRVVVHEYDSLIVGAGAGGSYFGHDEFAEHAPGMKTLADALDQRARIFGAFEMAELEDDPSAAPSGSPSWSSAAAPPGSRSPGRSPSSPRALSRQLPTLRPQNDVRVLLFDGGKEILATFGDKLSEIGRRELEATGVEVHTRVDRDARGRRSRRGQGAGRLGRSIRHARPRSGRPASRRHRWPRCWPTPPAPSRPAAAGSRCSRTARCPATPRCSRSAT